MEADELTYINPHIGRWVESRDQVGYVFLFGGRNGGR